MWAEIHNKFEAAEALVSGVRVFDLENFPNTKYAFQEAGYARITAVATKTSGSSIFLAGGQQVISSEGIYGGTAQNGVYTPMTWGFPLPSPLREVTVEAHGWKFDGDYDVVMQVFPKKPDDDILPWSNAHLSNGCGAPTNNIVTCHGEDNQKALRVQQLGRSWWDVSFWMKLDKRSINAPKATAAALGFDSSTGTSWLVLDAYNNAMYQEGEHFADMYVGDIPPYTPGKWHQWRVLRRESKVWVFMDDLLQWEHELSMNKQITQMRIRPWRNTGQIWGVRVSQADQSLSS